MTKSNTTRKSNRKAAKAEAKATEQKAEAKATEQKAEQPMEQHADKAAVIAEAVNAEGTENAAPRVSKSIVRAAYKTKYGALQGCGDEVGTELTAETTVQVGNKPTCSLERLQGVADANPGLRAILDGYVAKGLNIGQCRMNIGNRLRAMLKRGERVVIGKRVWDAEQPTTRKAA